MATREEYQARRKAWVAALRSGKYKQGPSRLKRVTRDGEIVFCCLGVACDISGLGSWDGDTSDPVYFADGHTRSGDLPPAVVEWIGMRTSDGALAYSDGLENLADINDNTDIGFDGIAELIENGAAELFIPEAL